MITPDELRDLASHDLQREKRGQAANRHHLRKALRQAATALEEAQSSPAPEPEVVDQVAALRAQVQAAKERREAIARGETP